MSTDKQEYSIQSQKRLLFEYAKNNNFNIINCYEDKGLSGRDAKKRPAFMSMINDSYKKNFEYILIYDSSRFARNLEQSLIYKSILKNNNIKIISATEPNISDDNQILTDAIIGAMNEMYSIRLSKVVKRGMKEKALKGEYMSQAPFGYTKPKGEPLKINDQEAPIVTKIFDDYLYNNMSYYSIAKTLNSLNVKTKKGNNIDTRFIRKVLTNPTYKGYYKFTSDGEVILNKSNHEPIIQEDIFDRVQEMINSNKHNNLADNKLTNNKHWLTGLIRCETCGSTYVYAKYSNNRQDRFRCGGYTTGKCTNWYSIKVSEIEDIVINELKSLKHFSNKTYELEPSHDHNNNSLNTNLIDNITLEIKKLKKGLLKIKQAYIMEVDTLEEYKQNKDLITAKIKELEHKLKAYNNNNLPDSNTNSIKLNLRTLNKSNINSYLASLIINKILIKNINNNVNINIFFNIY